MLKRIPYNAETGYWNSDPDTLERAIHRLASAVFECRGALISLGAATIGGPKIP